MDLHTTYGPFAADLPKPLTRAQIDLLVRQAHRDRARAQADLILALGRFPSPGRGGASRAPSRRLEQIAG